MANNREDIRTRRLTTDERQRFLRTLEKIGESCGTVEDAAVMADLEPHQIWTERRSDRSFDDEVYHTATQSLEHEAMRRALKKSDTLLIFLLKCWNPARYAQSEDRERFRRIEERGPKGMDSKDARSLAQGIRADLKLVQDGQGQG